MTQWIDSHVHLFTPETAGNPPSPIGGGINDVPRYLNGLQDKIPSGVVVVDFSKAKTSDHVIASLDELHRKNIPAKGIIRANIEDARTFDWIKRPDIAGVRFYAKTEAPNLNANKAQWDKLFTLLRSYHKHICIFGAPNFVRQLIEQIPNDLPILIDHLGAYGLADEGGASHHYYSQLLSFLSSRFKAGQSVSFKGPGYRTSFEPKKTVPFLLKIIEMFGESQLILGASDAPFAGNVVEKSGKYKGMHNQQVIGYDSILDYLNSLIELTATRTDKSFEILQMQLLYSNAQRLYQFTEAVKKAA